ncbi:MAG TPA: hypothetical protein VNB22_00355 [Pyrinomonadaceae bacterium]|nr:hypothetical protein [Pyrinomonadaceae bacterium]
MKNYELGITNYELFFLKILCVFCILGGANLSLKAQSTNQSFPTAVTSNELSGTIKARDLGDARLTTYFYVFNGRQGDVFINVVTKNLDGDIDIFTADNLKPLTKITVYSDNPDSETGRVIYLRQPQKLILRVEGKTPTDEPATFRIKFAGSFEPLAGVTAETDESKVPEVKAADEGGVRVNSVGTIIEVKPKPKPTPKPTTAKIEKEEPKKAEEKKEPEKVEETETAKKDEPVEEVTKKTEVVITDNFPEKKDDSESKTDESVAEKETPKKNPAPKKTVRPKKPATTAKTETKPKTVPEKKTEPAVDLSQLENIRLVVDFKDGRKIERPMSEILKFSVDKGILTIIAKDGSIGRYSILDIAKITVE